MFNRRRVVTLFAIARAFGGLISTMVVRRKLRQIEYSETALFCLCCSFLLYAVSLDPKLLFTGYYYSVLKWSRDYTDKKLNILFRVPGDKFLVEIRPPNALAMANKMTTRRLFGSSIAMVKPASPPAIQLFHPSYVK
jgi:hypothetical protein